jgi:hypothetical protein
MSPLQIPVNGSMLMQTVKSHVDKIVYVLAKMQQ